MAHKKTSPSRLFYHRGLQIETGIFRHRFIFHVRQKHFPRFFRILPKKSRRKKIRFPRGKFFAFSPIRLPFPHDWPRRRRSGSALFRIQTFSFQKGANSPFPPYISHFFRRFSLWKGRNVSRIISATLEKKTQGIRTGTAGEMRMRP